MRHASGASVSLSSVVGGIGGGEILCRVWFVVVVVCPAARRYMFVLINSFQATGSSYYTITQNMFVVE